MDNCDDPEESVSTAMNRADAVRKQSVEVVQLAKGDVEELHAKLKTLQDFLVKGEREKNQLESQLATLKRQLANNTTSAASTTTNNSNNSSDGNCVNVDGVAAGGGGGGSNSEKTNGPDTTGGGGGGVSERAVDIDLNSRDPNILLDSLLRLIETNSQTLIENHSIQTKLALLTSFLPSTKKGETEAGQNGSVEVKDQNANTSETSVEQCSQITDRLQDKVNKQQETIERLNNALEEVEIILEESHAKNAALQERLNKQLEQAADASGENSKGTTSQCATSSSDVIVDNTVNGESATSTSTNDATSSDDKAALTASSEEIERLKRELEEVTSRYDEACSKEKELEARCADFSHQIDNLTSQLAESANGLKLTQDLKKSLEAGKRDQQNLMKELSEVQANLNRVQSENDKLKAINAELDYTRGEVRRALDAAQEKAKTVSHELEKMKETQGSNSSKMTELMKSVEDLNARVADLTSNRDSLKNELETVKQREEETKKANETLARKAEEDLKLKQDEFVKQKQELEKLLEVSKESQKEIEGLKEKISSLEGVRVSLEKEKQSYLDDEKRQKEDAAKKCTELEKKIEELEGENESLKQEVSSAKSSVGATLETQMLLDELKTGLSTAKTQLDEKDKQIQSNNCRISELEGKLNENEQRRSQMQSKCSELLAAAEVMQKQFGENQAQLTAVRHQLEREKADKATLLSKITTLEREHSELMQKLTSQLSSKDAEKDELVQKTKSLEGKLELASKEIEETRQKLTEEKQKLEKMLEEKEKMVLEGRNAIDEVQGVQQKFDMLELQLKQKDEKISKLESSIEQQRAKLVHATDENGRLMEKLEKAEKMEQELVETTQKCQKLQKDSETWQETKEKLEAEVKSLSEAKSNLHVELVQSRQQLCDTTQFKTKMDKMKVECDELKSKNEELKKELEQMEKDHSETQRKSERSAQEMNKMKLELTTLKNNFARDKETLMSEIASLSEKHLKVNSELESVRCDRSAKQELINGLNSQVVALKGTNSSLIAKSTELQQKKDAIEAQINALKTDLTNKTTQQDKLANDLRSQLSHNDTLKKQVSTLVMAIAEKEKLIAGFNNETQNMRSQIVIFNEKLKTHDALINRIAQLESDLSNTKGTISKVCAEREESLKQLEEYKKAHAGSVKEMTLKVQQYATEAGDAQTEKNKLQDSYNELKKKHDIALSERTIAESRCRATLTLSRKLEKELAALQKSNERLKAEDTENKSHIKYLESEKAQLLETVGDLPAMVQNLQDENNKLKNRLNANGTASSEEKSVTVPAPATGRGRKPSASKTPASSGGVITSNTNSSNSSPNTKSMQSSDTNASSTSSHTPSVTSPSPQKEKRPAPFATLRAAIAEHEAKRLKDSPVRNRIKMFETKATTAAHLTGSQPHTPSVSQTPTPAAVPTPTASSKEASSEPGAQATPATNSSSALTNTTSKDSPQQAPSSARRGRISAVRRSASEAELSPGPSAAKRFSTDSQSQKDKDSDKEKKDSAKNKPGTRNKVSSSTEEEEMPSPAPKPRGRPSLTKGTPPKGKSPVAAVKEKKVLSTPKQSAKSPDKTPVGKGRRSLTKSKPSPISEVNTPSGRSLRASTLVVKKASDIDQRQRELLAKKKMSGNV